ncbi:hypothetical protein [Geoalkalibacter halelectricus]|uniref:Uncharacterized protein n=1 Tax=Geoalkalibacter halelectricus TaxID=2847045 RepID=A0ABY5ZNB6_9BACT|nr:hypothetical protein [Geoalkalibacter halelectricus]MDO3379831.1 hypothetical protein [Geoalkalibacter halelectricus]UWZ80637.1 hypothetical protein L9S41_04365 [Geoalkalibacter halelectricus]
MKKEEVPQDAGILGPWREVFYALDEQGRYVLVPSVGWDPANVANIQAWEVIAEDMGRAIQAVRDGEASPLAFHMARCQMDAALLSRYAQIAPWRVKRHLRPKVYAKLKPDIRLRYARIFGMEAEALDYVPAEVALPVQISEKSRD